MPVINMFKCERLNKRLNVNNYIVGYFGNPVLLYFVSIIPIFVCIFDSQFQYSSYIS